MKTAPTQLDAGRSVLLLSRDPKFDSVDGLKAAGWQVVHAQSTRHAERILERNAIKVGLIEMPFGVTSHDLADLCVCAARSDITWIAMVRAGQAGEGPVRRFILEYCFDYFTVPCVDDRLAILLGQAHGLSVLSDNLAAPPKPLLGHSGMIGSSPAMQQLFRDIEKCSRSDAPVFISGESGTGKELTARAIHTHSARSGEAFVAVNCAAIPPSLLQSELFGHERGAFTGALQRKIGRIEATVGGTLFLDEVGDMPPECQAVLLRFLQEGTIERLGGDGPIKVDVRVVSATHVDLVNAIEDGSFRSDLYHRLCVLRLEEPPLRDRGKDIELLAEHALSLHRRDGTRKIRGFTKDAMAAMFEHQWPGNVRELINCVRRAVVMAEGRFITTADLGLPNVSSKPGLTLAETRSNAVRIAILEALARHAHNLSSAAAELGISRSTLYRLASEKQLRNVLPDRAQN